VPELRRVVGEGLGMPRDQFVVACRRPGTPLTGLLRTADLAQYAGELCRVIGVVGGDRQRAQPGDRGVGLAERRLDFAQMALRRGVGRKAAMRGAEPTAPAPEIPLREPHLGTPKVQLRQRNRRDSAVAIPTLVE
jgi:hypothetical protein